MTIDPATLSVPFVTGETLHVDGGAHADHWQQLKETYRERVARIHRRGPWGTRSLEKVQPRRGDDRHGRHLLGHEEPDAGPGPAPDDRLAPRGARLGGAGR